MSSTKTDEGQRTRVCPHCSGPVRILSEHDRTVFFICDSCGTRGAYSPATNPVQRKTAQPD